MGFLVMWGITVIPWRPPLEGVNETTSAAGCNPTPGTQDLVDPQFLSVTAVCPPFPLPYRESHVFTVSTALSLPLQIVRCDEKYCYFPEIKTRFLLLCFTLLLIFTHD